MTVSEKQSGSEVVIRHCTLQDAGLLAELGARTFLETFAADNKPENMTEYLAKAFSSKQQASELSDASVCFKIAELEGLVVGYSMMRSGIAPSVVTGEKAIELVRLYVSRLCIGHGIGAALMEDCVREARMRGQQTIWLGVWENNHRAQAFYRKWNFVEVGTHTFQLGDDAQRDLLMQLSV